MPIEFRCPQCGKLLRTPDGTAGRQAKCPQCEALTMIPQPEAAAATAPVPDLPPMSPPPAPGESPNPYSSPMADEMRAAPGPVQRGFNPTRIDLGAVLSDSWQIYKARFWPCVLVTLVFFLIYYAMAFAMAYATRNESQVVQQLANLLLVVPNLFLSVGLLAYMLKVARGENASFADLFSGGPYLLNELGVLVLWYIAVLIGLLLLIIPAFIAMFMFSMAFLIVIDQNVGPWNAMGMSRRATGGNKLTLFALYLLMIVLALLGLLACLVGIVFVQPYLVLTYVVAYLAMTGQSIAVPRRN